MRLFTKFYALCALALCSIVYSAWFLASQNYYRRVILPHSVPEGSPQDDVQDDVEGDVAPPVDRRLVVFGDSWSDTNAAPSKGLVWTDHLCLEFSCDQANFAQTAKSVRGNYIGSVVDNAELSSSRTLFGLYRSPLADFKHQAREWLDAESHALPDFSDGEIRDRRNNTIFVVSFGVWDIWNLIGMDFETAVASVDRSTSVLMEQLDLLSEGWDPAEFKVILTLPPDLTFFPAFKSSVKGNHNRQKNTVRIVQYWTDRLRGTAGQSGLGNIHLFDTNAFIMDLIRDRELSLEGVEEDGLGHNEDPGWENVSDPCVTTRKEWLVMVDERQCENPELYLFWNGLHVGPSAHRLMGTQVYREIEEKWMR